MNLKIKKIKNKNDKKVASRKLVATFKLQKKNNNLRCSNSIKILKIMANNSFVKFENVQKSYDGEVLVVKDLNLEISKGEFLTMLGPSGSGKTTCLMMLAGF